MRGKLAAVVVIVIAATCGLALPSDAAALPLEAHDCHDQIFTSMKLANDLQCTLEDGLRVAANGVVIDLNGHRIRGDGTGAGVRANGFSSFKIRNGVIERFGYGVVIENGVGGATVSSLLTMKNSLSGILVKDPTTISGVRSILNGQNGIIGEDADGVQIKNNTTNRNTSWGIRLVDTDTFVVSGNTSQHNNEGIGISDAVTTEAKKITGNTFSENSLAGLFVSDSTNLTASGNVAKFNGNSGFLLGNVDDIVMKSNQTIDNGEAGVHIHTLSVGVDVIDHVAKRNGQSGLLSVDSGSFHVRDSVFSNNTGNGLEVRKTGGAFSGSVKANTLNSNGIHGLLANLDDFPIDDNIAKKNGFVNGVDGTGLGFSAPLTTQGSGNVATGNDDSEQCVPASLCA